MVREELTVLVKDYFNEIPELKGYVPSAMLVGFVMEKYKQVRNFPSAFTQKQIDDDMRKHMHTLAMAVVDLTMKSGAEGETSHKENGTDRKYENAYISNSIFGDVMPYVGIL